MLTPDKPPPEDYYQNNCLSLFGFVQRHYGDLLESRGRRQLEKYSGLADDAQRLFARLLTRKGPLIRVEGLHYDEISDLSTAIYDLEEQGFILCNPAAAGDLLLGLLKKSELIEFSRGRVAPNQSKQAMLNTLLSACSDIQIHQRMCRSHRWLRIADEQLWWLVRLLYFGDTVQDWSAFVLRDLGLIRYEPFKINAKRFQSNAALQVDLHYRRLSALSRRLDDYPALARELKDLLGETPAVTEDRFVRARRARILLRLGRWHERLNQAEQAVTAYMRVGVHPARERIVRVLQRQGDEGGVERWLEAIRNAPLSDEESQFSERFGKRQAGFQPRVTELEIQQAETDIEQQALALLLQDAQEQAWGAHVENSLLRTLTGLLYWDAIFADVPGAFTNPFQSGPHDLHHADFTEARWATIQEIDRRLDDDERLEQHLLETARVKQGVANSLVDWRLLENIPLDRFILAMPVEHIRTLTGFMIRNLAQHKSGLPDLFVSWEPKRYEFIEVKGPSDQLQPGQRVWFKQLHRLDIPARVLKLRLSA